MKWAKTLVPRQRRGLGPIMRPTSFGWKEGLRWLFSSISLWWHQPSLDSEISKEEKISLRWRHC